MYLYFEAFPKTHYFIEKNISSTKYNKIHWRIPGEVVRVFEPPTLHILNFQKAIPTGRKEKKEERKSDSRVCTRI